MEPYNSPGTLLTAVGDYTASSLTRDVSYVIFFTDKFTDDWWPAVSNMKKKTNNLQVVLLQIEHNSGLNDCKLRIKRYSPKRRFSSCLNCSSKFQQYKYIAILHRMGHYWDTLHLNLNWLKKFGGYLRLRFWLFSDEKLTDFPFRILSHFVKFFIGGFYIINGPSKTPILNYLRARQCQVGPSSFL